MILGLMLVAVPGFSRTAVSEVHVTIRLMDYVGLPASARSEAVDTAKHILGQAGVAVDFIECYSGGMGTGTPACAAPLGPTDLILRICPPRMAAKGTQLAYAAMTADGGVYITVFVDPAKRIARIRTLSDGVLLGHSIAHEIGHMLLGANSHSSSGIMRAVWRLVDEEWMAKGALVFDAGQAKAMRSVLMARSSR